MLKSPCKGCEYRIVGCHAQCEPYTKYSNGLINQRKDRDKSGDILGYVKDTTNRVRRRIGKPKYYGQ